MSERKSRRGWTGVLVLLIALIFVVLIRLLLPSSFRGETLPNPNGYDDLIAASKTVTGNVLTVTELEKADTEELRALIGKNREALARASVGLGRQSVVALAKSPSVEAHFENFGALRTLGRLLACEAALIDLEGHAPEAARLYGNVIRYGRAISDGGVLPERLAEGPVQHAGLQGLNRLIPTLSANESQQLAKEFERLDRDREPLAHVFDRDLEFNLARGGWPARAAYYLHRKSMQTMLSPAKAAAEKADRLNQIWLRLFASALALRAYRLDHPDAPVPPTLDALVPTYLEAVPFDPFSQGPLKFKVQGDTVQVYSVGSNGRDDGGTVSPSRNPAEGDLRLESP
ncbi:type II secretion system protein G (GspG) [Singulisphaera acidiphila DSM 18658]|uniref:Type II secretion system protein G (GspG) n=2 Tax=Singulisphaera acidiphila TaxID=466153 RepID=L0DMK1_SINAD|nr:type II secretion system protein G (GspG) [Singulisphaera acidiphila DSM 18658]